MSTREQQEAFAQANAERQARESAESQRDSQESLKNDAVTLLKRWRLGFPTDDLISGDGTLGSDSDTFVAANDPGDA